MGRALLVAFAGILIGIVLGAAGSRALTPAVVVEGVVEYEAPNPGATAAPPEGFYVRGRIYVDGLTRESVGKTITAEGRLGSVPDSDHHRRYPKLYGPGGR